MYEDNSPILDFYPVEFEQDLNGKKQEWEAIVKIPFIDEQRLLKADASRALAVIVPAATTSTPAVAPTRAIPPRHVIPPHAAPRRVARAARPYTPPPPSRLALERVPTLISQRWRASSLCHVLRAQPGSKARISAYAENALRSPRDRAPAPTVEPRIQGKCPRRVALVG